MNPGFDPNTVELRICPFALSLSKGERINPSNCKIDSSCFDKFSTNGCVNSIGL